MRARIRDTELFFDVDGASLISDGAVLCERPTAFLVHGGPGVDHASLKVRYAALSREMQLVYFDHRGHGRSARGDVSKYTLDENVEDMEALRRYLGLERIVSIGTSYGGRVALAHAARYPSAVSHLILIATSAHAGSLMRAKQFVAERGTAEQIAMFEELHAGRINSTEKLQLYHTCMASLYSERHDARSAISGATTILSAEPVVTAYGEGGFLWKLDLRPELHTITAPTLIIAGRRDWICPPEFAEEIHRLIPRSELQVFEDSSHNVASDEPERCINSIIEFVMRQGCAQ